MKNPFIDMPCSIEVLQGPVVQISANPGLTLKVPMKGKIGIKFYVLVLKNFLSLKRWCLNFFNILFSFRNNRV